MCLALLLTGNIAIQLVLQAVMKCSLGYHSISSDTLSSVFYNYPPDTKFGAAVDKLQKIKSPFESWDNLKTNSSFTIFATKIYPCKIEILPGLVNVQTVDGVSELRAHYPMSTKFHSKPNFTCWTSWFRKRNRVSILVKCRLVQIFQEPTTHEHFFP